MKALLIASLLALPLYGATAPRVGLYIVTDTTKDDIHCKEGDHVKFQLATPEKAGEAELDTKASVSITDEKGATDFARVAAQGLNQVTRTEGNKKFSKNVYTVLVDLVRPGTFTINLTIKDVNGTATLKQFVMPHAR